MNVLALPVLMLSLTLSAVVPPAHTQNLVDRRQPLDDRHANGGVSLDEAVQMAESRYRAKAVRATTINSGDRRIHQIRLIRDGRVWTVNVDAQTGDMN